MRTSTSFPLSRCVASMLLTGCAGSQPLIGAPGTTDLNQPLARRRTFHYAGKEQFMVPTSVRSIKVTALGAPGTGSRGALGGLVTAVIPVVSREKLAVFVGGAGSENSDCPAAHRRARQFHRRGSHTTLRKLMRTIPITELRCIRPQQQLQLGVADFHDEIGIGKAHRVGWEDLGRGFASVLLGNARVVIHRTASNHIAESRLQR
jgi:hypothetical protein